MCFECIDFSSAVDTNFYAAFHGEGPPSSCPLCSMYTMWQPLKSVSLSLYFCKNGKIRESKGLLVPPVAVVLLSLSLQVSPECLPGDRNPFKPVQSAFVTNLALVCEQFTHPLTSRFAFGAMEGAVLVPEPWSWGSCLCSPWFFPATYRKFYRSRVSVRKLESQYQQSRGTSGPA